MHLLLKPGLLGEHPIVYGTAVTAAKGKFGEVYILPYSLMIILRIS